MKPLLKWPGGKRRIAAEIVSMMSTCVGDESRYIELFAGGAAVFFHLEPKRAVLVDVCKPVIAFYEAVRREPVAFYGELERLLSLPFTEETYNSIKSEWNGNDYGIRFAARLLYMNKTGFNGLFRLNASGGYNVAWGKKEKLPEFPSKEEILAAADLLRQATLYCMDFSYVLRGTHIGDVVYADPPYFGTYDRYSASGFQPKDHGRLAVGLQRAAQRGVSVFTSNIDCQDTRRMYSWAKIKEIDLLHKISCTTEGRKTVKEIVAWSISPYMDARQMSLFGEKPEAFEEEEVADG